MPYTTLNQFKQHFGSFCQTANIDSGKGNSYACAIWYLYEYLFHKQVTTSTIFDENTARLVLAKQAGIRNSGSQFYRDLETFLDGRQQKSYLTKGYIKAALPYLERFIARGNF